MTGGTPKTDVHRLCQRKGAKTQYNPKGDKNPKSKQRLHAAGVVHAPDCFAEQVCNAKDGQLRELIARGSGDGVGDNDFLENATGQTLCGGRA
jgi:hypothetical protein